MRARSWGGLIEMLVFGNWDMRSGEEFWWVKAFGCIVKDGIGYSCMRDEMR